MEGTSPRRALSGAAAPRHQEHARAPTGSPPRPTAVAGSCCSATTSTAPCRRSRSCSTRRCWPSARSWRARSTTTPGSTRCRSSRCRRRRPRPCRSCPTTTGAAPRRAQKYEQIKDLLGREMLDQRFAGMKQALENATDEDRQRVNEMLDDLNDLLDKHSRGEDTQQDFEDFMTQARRVLPGEPAERRRAAGLAGPAGGGGAAVPQQPVRRSARRAGCVGAAGIRLAVADECAQPARLATCRRPGPARTGTARRGSPATTRWAWARARRRWPTSPSSSSSPSSCRRATPGATMDDVDLDALARQLGDEAAVDARTLAELETRADEPGLPGPRLRRAVAAVAEGHAPARPDRASRCGPTAFGPTRRARHPSGRGGRRADRARRGRGSSATPSRGTSPAR